MIESAGESTSPDLTENVKRWSAEAGAGTCETTPPPQLPRLVDCLCSFAPVTEWFGPARGGRIRPTYDMPGPRSIRFGEATEWIGLHDSHPDRWGLGISLDTVLGLSTVRGVLRRAQELGGRLHFWGLVLPADADSVQVELDGYRAVLADANVVKAAASHLVGALDRIKTYVLSGPAESPAERVWLWC